MSYIILYAIRLHYVIWYYMILLLLLYIYIYVYGLQNLDQLVIVSWSLGRRRPRTSQGTAGAAGAACAACAASKAREDVFGTGGQKRW